MQDADGSANTAADECLTPEDLRFLYTFVTRQKRSRSLNEDLESDADSDAMMSSVTTASPTDTAMSHHESAKVSSLRATAAAPAAKQRRSATMVNQVRASSVWRNLAFLNSLMAWNGGVHIVTQEMKKQLYDEVMHLEARAALLRHETGQVEPQVLKSKRALRADLSDAVLQHELQLAAMQSMFSGFTHSRVTSPLETYIHLTTDWQQRRRVLLAMKQQKIDVAHRFLAERTRFMCPFQECSEQSKYTTEDGDTYVIKMDVTPFEGVTSVRQVFNAVLFYMTNLNITLTKIADNIMIRETDENDETAVLQHCFATYEHDGVLLEKNDVVFMDTSGLNSSNVDEQSALFTFDFVDRDDLYPYHPNQRLRKDASTVVKLSAHRRKRVAAGLDSGRCVGEEDDLVVVLTRWSSVRLRRSQIAIPRSAIRSVANNLTCGFDYIIKAMREGGCRISSAAY